MYAKVEDVEQTSWIDEEQTARFLAVLFAQKPSGAYINVWTLPDKKSKSFRDVAEAAKYAAREAESKDVYVQVGYSDKPVASASRRYSSAEISSITALWADVDVEHPVHKKGGVAKSYEAARAVVRSIGLEPTLELDSGHGLQAWWVLETPLAEEGAALVSEAWTHALQAHATARGCPNGVDSTQDLARVLRVAGTVNYKEPDAPRPVTILECDESRRYTLDEIRAAIAAAPVSEEERTAPRAPAEPSVVPTMEDARIHDLASHAKRTGPKYLALHYGDISKYPSPSEADHAYIRFLAFWTNDAEQIERMWRASPLGMNRDPKKRDRADYLQRGITKILATQKEHYHGGAWSDDDLDDTGEEEELETAPDALGTDSEGAGGEEVSDAFQPASAAPATAGRATGKTTKPAADAEARKERQRKKARAVIKKTLGVPIRRIIQYGETSAYYEVELENGKTYPIGAGRDYRSAARFADALTDAHYNVAVRIPKGGWAGIFDLLLILTEVIATEGENDETLDWLYEFALAHQRVALYRTPEETYESLQALIDSTDSGYSVYRFGYDRDGRMYIRSETLVNWLQNAKMKIFTRQAFAKRLHKLKFAGGGPEHQITASMTGEDGTHQLKCRVWISPAGFLDDLKHRNSSWREKTEEERDAERSAWHARKQFAVDLHYRTRFEG